MNHLYRPFFWQSLRDFIFSRPNDDSQYLYRAALNKSIKRRALLRWLHNQNKDLIFLQETYSSKETANMWEADGKEGCCSTMQPHTAKVLWFFLNPKVNYKIENISQDKNGRFIIAKLITEDTYFNLVNVYSPNDVNQQVLSVFRSYVKSFLNLKANIKPTIRTTSFPGSLFSASIVVEKRPWLSLVTWH